jgi:DNA-binding CsgD family transcriptional regulator
MLSAASLQPQFHYKSESDVESARLIELWAALEMSDFPMIVVDNRGMAVTHNQQFADFIGKSGEDFSGTAASDLFLLVSPGHPKDICRHGLSRGIKCSCSRVLLQPGSDKEYSLKFICTSARSDRNQPGVIFCAMRDSGRGARPNDAGVIVHELMERYRIEVQKKSDAVAELLSVLQVEKEKISLACRENIQLSIIPWLKRLKECASPAQIPLIKALEESILGITSPILQHLHRRDLSLSARELQICQMIRNGMSSKEIAGSLNTSEETVRVQRKSIRRKLGISNKSITLQAALENI